MAITIEERLAGLEKAAAKHDAIQAVQNVMGKYAYMHTAGKHVECMDLFALDTPGTTVEMMWGVYEGREGIKRCYEGWHVDGDGDGIGIMHMHALSTPVIEVADDLKTVKAVWLSPGHETGKNPNTGDFEAYWAWMKYGADFIKEGNEWKIWHLHVYGVFFTPYDKSWVESALGPAFDPPSFDTLPEAHRPDRAPRTGWEYKVDKKYPYDQPTPPEAYSTFKETFSY